MAGTPPPGHGPGASPGEGLRRVVAALADGVVVVDGSGRVRFANPAACALFERPLASLLGADFGYPVTAGETTEIELLVAGRPRLVEMRTRASTWNREAVVVASLRDVTEWARAVTDREAALREVETVLRAQEADLAVASHELRNPVAVVLGMVQTLHSRWGLLSEPLRLELVERIEVNLERVQRLVANLLSATVIDSGVPPMPQVFDVAGLVAGCVAALGAAAAEVAVVCPVDLLAYADPDHVGEILDNYLENAFKYGEPPIEVIATARHEAVEVHVRDHGPGVDPEFVPRLFDRYSRAPGVGRTPGSGLGLSIVAELARANGGKAWYEAGDPTGACFCVRVPAAYAPNA